MIHDILLSLLNPNSGILPIEDFMVSNSLSQFLHPSEKKILDDILKIAYQHKELVIFTRGYGVNLRTSPIIDPADEEPLQKGLYLQAFALGIEQVLEKYLHEIAELEVQYLEKPSHSLLFIFHKINVYQPLFSSLQKLIRGIKTQRFHGCGIMHYLHQHILHGNDQINDAVKTIQSSVTVAFLKQLTHWLLYGKLVDTYGEFFIQCSEPRNTTPHGSDRCTSTESGKHTATTISDAASSYAEIWRYEVCYELLPGYFSPNWAEKVLFIGQTVLMFKVDANKEKKKAHIWNELENNTFIGSLWNDKEHTFFDKIEGLQRNGFLNVSQYERVIDEIKSYVTERLSQIAIDQADLVKQLKLIKDFFLLGRGELYLEFIKRTQSIDKSSTTENTIRDLVKAFDLAAHSVNVVEELERFSFCVPKEKIESSDLENFGYIQFITLQYKINWPLHLLFSPKVIEKYNELFRFLLLIKRTQYDLHTVWCYHRKESSHQNVNILQLRNQLMFLIDNLQYYIQVDVLESQFSIFMNTVLSSSDFEHIQRAHSIFQANILSLCFLFTNEDANKTSTTQNKESPVFTILNRIFHLCEAFCNQITAANNNPLTKSASDEFSLLNKELSELIKLLLDLLVSLKAAPSSTPLSQLLLRLDFNYWFSTQWQAQVE